MSSVYFVSTYYHALIACVKQLVLPKEGTDIVVTAHIPDGEALAERIRQSGLFGRTVYSGEISEYRGRGLGYLLRGHSRNAAIIGRQTDIDFAGYEDIYIFHDDTWMSHYCQDRRIPYHLIEDALDSYKSLSESVHAYMIPRFTPKNIIKRLFGIGYVFSGMSPCVRSIEVNDLDGVQLCGFRKKAVCLPRSGLFGALDEASASVLLSIFMKQLPERAEGLDILLTSPAAADGILPSEQAQLEAYRELVRRHIGEGVRFAIKPHPRDTLDYSGTFPEAVILDKNMPAEVLSLAGVRFGRAIALSSTTLRSVPFAESIASVDVRELLGDAPPAD